MNPRDGSPAASPDPNSMPESPRTFPRPGTTYHDMICDPKSKKRFRGLFRFFNMLIAPLYRLGLLPLLGVGKLILLLTTRGRKSGRLRYTPIGYFRYGGAVHFVSGWGTGTDRYENMLAYPDDVHARIGFHRFHARAELVRDREELTRMMKWLVSHHTSGMEGRAMGWDPKRDDPETADFSGMFEKMAIVRLREQA
jgi:deazaflavin-dependent oxidoreductase (nitroreductase family)